MIAIASLALLAGLASCQKEGTGKENEQETPKVEIGHVTLTASFPKTRVSYAETAANNLKPSWEVGDKIFCTADGKTYYKFTVDTIKDDGSATISSESAPTDGTVALVYKKGLEGVSNPADLNFSMDKQSGDDSMPNVLFASGEIKNGTGTFEFTSGNSVVGVSCAKALAGKTIKSISVGGSKLSTNSCTYRSKIFTAKAGGKTLESISTADLTSKNITVGTDGVFSEPVFIAVPAGAVIHWVTITPTEGIEYPIVVSEPKTTVENQYYYVKDIAVPAPPEGAIKGLFSVSPTKQVYFSPGNLKYTIGTQKWEFFENQYDFDKGEGTETIKPSKEYISFFCWGYNSENSIKPDDESENDPFVDWGSIFADGNTWRTLTKDEWNYLIDRSNKNTNYVRRGMTVFGVTVNGVEDCVVLYPDGYSGTKVNTMDSSTYNSEEAYFAATAEGIVFLPMTGYREQEYDYYDEDYFLEHEDYPYVPFLKEGYVGYYWTSSQGSSGAYMVQLGNGTGSLSIYDEFCSYGYAVRLVSDFNR